MNGQPMETPSSPNRRPRQLRLLALPKTVIKWTREKYNDSLYYSAEHGGWRCRLVRYQGAYHIYCAREGQDIKLAYQGAVGTLSTAKKYFDQVAIEGRLELISEISI